MVLKRGRPASAVARSPSTEWWWPPSPTIFRTVAAGYTSFEHTVLLEVDPGAGAPYVWAHDFKLIGGRDGYIGLESGSGAGERGGGTFAVFSIEGGTPLPTCRVPCRWEAGWEFGLRVWTDAPGWWAAGVRGPETGEESLVGRIQVPSDWRRLGSRSTMRTEYRGQLADCAQLPPCWVTYSVPTADGRTIAPERHESRLGPGTCPGSRTEVVPNGIRHVIGERR